MRAAIFGGALLLGGALAIFGISSVWTLNWSLVCVAPILIACIFFFPHEHSQFPIDQHRQRAVKIWIACAVLVAFSAIIIIRSGKIWLCATFVLIFVATWCVAATLKHKKNEAERELHIQQSYALSQGQPVPVHRVDKNEGSLLVGTSLLTAIAALAAAIITGYMTLQGTFRQSIEQKQQAQNEQKMKVYADFVSSQSELCDQIDAVQSVFTPRINDSSIRQTIVEAFAKLVSDNHRNDQILKLIDHQSPDIEKDRSDLLNLVGHVYDLVMRLQNSPPEDSAGIYTELITNLDDAKKKLASYLNSFSEHARADLARPV